MFRNFFWCRGVRGWSSAHHHNKRRRRRKKSCLISTLLILRRTFLQNLHPPPWEGGLGCITFADRMRRKSYFFFFFENNKRFAIYFSLCSQVFCQGAYFLFSARFPIFFMYLELVLFIALVWLAMFTTPLLLKFYKRK